MKLQLLLLLFHFVLASVISLETPQILSTSHKIQESEKISQFDLSQKYIVSDHGDTIIIR